MTAQPHGPTSPTPCTNPLIHLKHTLSHTHGLPHQDTVLHMNSGLNSILLGLRQQINRSSSATGNHILGHRTGPEVKRLKGQASKHQYLTRQCPANDITVKWGSKCINKTMCDDKSHIHLSMYLCEGLYRQWQQISMVKDNKVSIYSVVIQVQ